MITTSYDFAASRRAEKLPSNNRRDCLSTVWGFHKVVNVQTTDYSAYMNERDYKSGRTPGSEQSSREKRASVFYFSRVAYAASRPRKDRVILTWISA